MSTLKSIRDMLVSPYDSSHDRRTRPRLRELCDEVLASFRVAKGEDLFSDADRRAARVYLPTTSHQVSR